LKEDPLAFGSRDDPSKFGLAKDPLFLDLDAGSIIFGFRCWTHYSWILKQDSIP